jgi:hypothetical protein
MSWEYLASQETLGRYPTKKTVTNQHISLLATAEPGNPGLRMRLGWGGS